MNTIQVVDSGQETEAAVEREIKLLDKMRSSSRQLQKSTQEKSRLLRNKVGAYFSSKSQSKVAPQRETNDGPNNKSVLGRFVKKVQTSSIKQNTMFKSVNVKKVNFRFPKLEKSINDIRVKLRKSSDDKSEPNETKNPKTLKITNSGNTETYTAAPINDDIDFKAIKKKIVDFPENLKHKMLHKKSGKSDKDDTKKNNRFSDFKGKFS